MNRVAEPVAGETAAGESAWRSHYTLSLLTIIYALNHLDRSIFSIVLQSIKMEMQLSDKALGLIGGLRRSTVCRTSVALD